MPAEVAGAELKSPELVDTLLVRPMPIPRLALRLALYCAPKDNDTQSRPLRVSSQPLPVNEVQDVGLLSQPKGKELVALEAEAALRPPLDADTQARSVHP